MSVHHPAVDVGAPPSSNECLWETTEVRFHGCMSGERLPLGDHVHSDHFPSLGHNWHMTLWPAGFTDAAEGMTSLFVTHDIDEDDNDEDWENNDFWFGFRVKDPDGREVVNKLAKYEPDADDGDADHDDDDDDDDYNGGRGFNNFCLQSKLMASLLQGTLIVEVRIRGSKPLGSRFMPPFVPKNPLNNNILKLFMDEETSDVVFEVKNGSESGKRTRKRSKKSTTFHAHRLILLNGAPVLAELCNQGGGDSASVSINDVTPDIFQHMLHYVYEGKLLDEDLKANSKDIIEAADRYGVVNLKLEAEACYVKSTTFTKDNILDNLLYADAKNLAVLKEAVMDYMVENGDDIIGKVSFDNVPGSIVTDLLTAMTRGKAKDEGVSDSPNYNKMSVGSLRKMLHEKNLEVDGSREVLIKRLEEVRRLEEPYNRDIELVMSQAGCSRAMAAKALEENDNDLVNAIMSLTT